MSKDEQAIHPQTFSVTEPQEVEDIQEEDQDQREREEAVADLKHHIGFQKVRSDIENRIASYRSGDGIKIDGSEDFEAIGRKYLISSLVATELEMVLGTIDAAAEAKRERS